MKNIAKWSLILLVVLAGFAWGRNPCSWEVGYVNRNRADLMILIDLNSPQEDIDRKYRQLMGALFTLDLCLVEHNLM